MRKEENREQMNDVSPIKHWHFQSLVTDTAHRTLVKCWEAEAGEGGAGFAHVRRARKPDSQTMEGGVSSPRTGEMELACST